MYGEAVVLGEILKWVNDAQAGAAVPATVGGMAFPWGPSARLSARRNVWNLCRSLRAIVTAHVSEFNLRLNKARKGSEVSRYCSSRFYHALLIL